MPEPMPYDDPFAGIFGDPSAPKRPHTVSSTAPGPVRSRPPQQAPVHAAFAPAPAESTSSEPAAPGSRRAAREAAARSVGEVPVADSSAPQRALELAPETGSVPGVPQTAFPVPMPGAQEPATGFTPLPLRPVRTSYDFDDSAYVPTAADDPFTPLRDPSTPGPMRTPNAMSSPATHLRPVTAPQPVPHAPDGDAPTALMPSLSPVRTSPERVEPTPTAALIQLFSAEPAADTAAAPSAAGGAGPAIDSLFPTAMAASPAEPMTAAVARTTQPQTPQQDSTFEDLFNDITPPSGSGGKGGGKGNGGGGSPRRGRVGGWVVLGIVVVLLGGLVAGGMWAYNTYGGKVREVMGWTEPIDYESGKAHGEAIVTINDGDGGQAISQALAEAGVTKTPQAFYKMLTKSGQNPTFFPGTYKLKKEMTSAAALTALQDPANKLQNTALIREGLTQDRILKSVSASTKIPLAQLQAAAKNPAAYGVKAKSLEGWLFPARYDFEPGVTAKQVIQTMVDRTRQSLDEQGVPAADQQRILTIASIIQREARFEKDFYKVSRVIQNRLDPKNQETAGKLQMDSTAQYGYGEMHDGTVSSSKAALQDPNPWNTYVHAGLPVGPISSPGDLAIKAAMHPAKGPWLYFVTVDLDKGTTVFSSTYADQQKAEAQWHTWCKAHPDSGC